jgi:lipopolysaccharide transport system permease protein
MTTIAVRTSRPPRVLESLSPVTLVRNLWEYRELVRQFSIRETVARYKGTHLGLAWTVGQPLLTLAVFTFVFSTVFDVRWGTNLSGEARVDYALNFFAGLVLYSVFSETVGRAPGLILEKPNFVRKVVFPLEILPVAALGASMIYALISVGVLLAAALVLAGRFSPTLWLFPLTLVPLAAFTLGLSWFLCSMGVFIRDIKNVVAVLLQLLFFATPITFPLETLQTKLGGYAWVVYLNPLTAILEDGRRTLLLGQQPEWFTLGVSTLVGLLVMQAGYAWFRRSRQGFADVL